MVNINMTILFLLITILMVTIPFNNYATTIGTKEISFTFPSSDRTVVAEIYYPIEGKEDKAIITHGIWKRKSYIKDAPLSTISTKISLTSSYPLYPLILFSHGFQGDRFGNSWIAEELVAKGYVVIMIDHTHNTSYDHNDLFLYMNMWQRPLDISQLLTFFLQQSEWKKVIDSTKIVVAGFSLGGTTALWTGGIKADETSFKNVMNDNYSRWSDWPEDSKIKAQKVDWKQATASYYDSRIKAVIALAPDLGRGFTVAGLKQMKIPSLIIVGDKDQVTPAKENASYFASSIPQSKLTIINGAEHFSFMNNCSPLGMKITPMLCRHDLDTQKSKIHQQVMMVITQFLSKIKS